MLRPLFVALIVAALLTPVLFRRQRRKAGLSAGALTPRFRRRLFVTMGLSRMVLVVGLSRHGIRRQRRRHRSKTGISNDQVETVVPVGKTPAEITPIRAATSPRTSSRSTTSWLMVGGILVLFMQAGFALVETGFTRAKNAAHTMMMNLVIFALGTVGWFVCGYALDVRVRGASGVGDHGPWVRRAHRRLVDHLAFRVLPRWPGVRRRHPELLLLPTRVHGCNCDDPDRGHGRAVQVLRASSSGACSPR